MKTPLETATVETPAGPFWFAAKGGALVAAGFADSAPRLFARLEARLGPLEPHEASDPAGAVSALRRFLAGELAALESVPVDLAGTPFQRDVWTALREIPAGSTITYAELARRIGKPTAVRAVANACARNNVAVVIPCHRAVRSDGGLGGYRWGVERKERLLQAERSDK